MWVFIGKKIHLNLYCKFVKLKSKLSQEFIMYVLFANVMLLDTLQPGYINPVNFEASHKDSPDHNIIWPVLLGEKLEVHTLTTGSKYMTFFFFFKFLKTLVQNRDL